MSLLSPSSSPFVVDALYLSPLSPVIVSLFPTPHLISSLSLSLSSYRPLLVVRHHLTAHHLPPNLIRSFIPQCGIPAANCVSTRDKCVSLTGNCVNGTCECVGARPDLPHRPHTHTTDRSKTASPYPGRGHVHLQQLRGTGDAAALKGYLGHGPRCYPRLRRSAASRRHSVHAFLHSATDDPSKFYYSRMRPLLNGTAGEVRCAPRCAPRAYTWIATPGYASLCPPHPCPPRLRSTFARSAAAERPARPTKTAAATTASASEAPASATAATFAATAPSPCVDAETCLGRTRYLRQCTLPCTAAWSRPSPHASLQESDEQYGLKCNMPNGGGTCKVAADCNNGRCLQGRCSCNPLFGCTHCTQPYSKLATGQAQCP